MDELLLEWLHTAGKRFDLCVLDYSVTSNHIHLIVRDRGRGEIARSMQLIAGRTGHQFNDRTQRRGAFWEDRDHAPGIESGEHLARCVVYVDLNRVRAGVVAHLSQWHTCGYHEIQKPPRRFGIIDRQALAEVLEVPVTDLPGRHARWIDAARAGDSGKCVCDWSSSGAVGRREFVEGMPSALKRRANGRELKSFTPFENSFVRRGTAATYARPMPTFSPSKSSAETAKLAVCESKSMRSRSVSLVRPRIPGPIAGWQRVCGAGAGRRARAGPHRDRPGPTRRWVARHDCRALRRRASGGGRGRRCEQTAPTS